MSTKIGDIFVASWGYDQTNIDFYQIIDVSKSGKTVKARRIRAKHEDAGYAMSSKVTPLKDNFLDSDSPYDKNYGGVFTARLKKAYDVRKCFRVTSYCHAYEWDGESRTETSIR